MEGGSKYTLEKCIFKIKNFFKKNKQTVMTCIAAFLIFGIVMTVPSFAATNIFERAQKMMNKVYIDIASISTVSAGVAGAVCLFLCLFSKNQKAVDEARAWGKRIIICYVGIMLMGSILYYVTNRLGISSSSLSSFFGTSFNSEIK